MSGDNNKIEVDTTPQEGDEDLPILRTDFLPVPIPPLGPIHIEAPPRITGWKNCAHQCDVRDVARCMQRDELWAATSGGVLRWYPNRNQFTRYTSEHGLPGNSVSAIVIDDLGQCWCAPDYGGLYLLKDNAWLLHDTESAMALPIRCLTTDTNGCVWASNPEGLFRLGRDGSVTHRFQFNAVEAPRSITVTEWGDVWACSSQGLFVFSKSGIHQVGKLPNLLTLACYGKSLWVGKSDGLVKIDLDSRKARQEENWPAGSVTALLPYPQGVYLVCDNILGRLSEAGWESFCSIGGRGSKLITDRADGIFLSTSRGLMHWSESEAANFVETKAIPDQIYQQDSLTSDIHLSNLIQCLTIENGGNGPILWGGTHQGLFRHNPGGYESDAWRHYALDGIVSIQALTTGLPESDLWISGWSGGVFVLKPSGSIEEMPGVTAPILSLSTGFGGTRWAVGTDGIYRSSRQRWELVVNESQLRVSAELRAIAQTGKNELWLGTSKGLINYNLSSGGTTIPQDPSFAYPINALAYDSTNDRLWAGTDVGLFGLRRSGEGWAVIKKFRFTVLNSGLPTNRIVSLTVDTSVPASAILWIGTACGLCQFQYKK